ATAVLAKVTEETLSDNETSAYYSVAAGDLHEDTGNVMNYWTGAGRCLDFSGIPVFEAFSYSPDRKALQEDASQNSNWLNSYAIDWPSVELTGNTYLRTIFYTPQKKQGTVISESDNMEFVGGGKTIGLNGFTNEEIDSMETVFRLVESRDLCISSNGASASFWWNPRKVYLDSGVHDLTTALDVDNDNCIGYANPAQNAGIPDTETTDPESPDYDQTNRGQMPGKGSYSKQPTE
ncbi:MAG: hypothetical protein ABIA76_00960, partial [Candidatus Diapherotrites archaeon]